MRGLLRFLPALAFSIGLALVLAPAPAGSSADDRSINLLLLSPDNTFDNATAGDSIGFRIAVTGASGVAAEAPDNQGGNRVEFYNSAGTLVRRRASQENDANTTTIVYWDGQGDSDTADTLAYGSYTLRAYQSMRDLAYSTKIQATDAAIVIDRPGDLHVTSGGLLSWTNTGASLTFCQATLGDPNTSDATFIRKVAFPAGFGSSGTDQAYGIAADAAGNVYVSDNQNGGAAGMRIGKYNTGSQTWTANWADNDSTTATNEDEWLGLFIDERDSVLCVGATGIAGGGEGSTRSYARIFRSEATGSTEAVVSAQSANGDDYYDIARHFDDDTYIYVTRTSGNDILRFAPNLATSAALPTFTGSGLRSIAVDTEGNLYVARASSFVKIAPTGVTTYTFSDSKINGASGIAVWDKASTGEKFIVVASQTNNQIHIYKESVSNTAAYVRAVPDDVNAVNDPVGLASNAAGDLFVVARGSDAVKRFTSEGVFSALTGAPNGQYLTGSDATSNLSDTSGFNTPGAVAVDGSGNIYVFDQEAGFSGDAAIKRFSSNGTPDSVVWYDLDANVPGGVWAGEITMAVFADGAIYGASAEPDARIFRLDVAAKTATWLDPGFDVYGIAVAPLFNRASDNFYPAALHVFSRNAGGAPKYYVYTTDLVTNLKSGLGPEGLGNGSAVTTAFLVDRFGEIYMIPEEGAASYDFRRYNAATPEAEIVANGLGSDNIAQGTSDGQLDGPRQMIWVGGDGVFVFNPSTQRYEEKIWVNDSNNDRLQQFVVAWNDVEETSVIITPTTDIPAVISQTTTGNTVTTIGGVKYAGVCTLTVTINVNNSVATETTPSIQIKPNGAGYETVVQTGYGGTSWTGRYVVTDTTPEGQAEFKVEGIHDTSAPVTLINPNPDRSEDDGADDFLHIVIDRSPPVGSVSDPADSTTTSNSTYSVSGSITSEATGKDATIVMSIYTAQTGGTEFDSYSTTASESTGNFSGTLDLRSPAPIDNWLEVVAIDKLGHRTGLVSPRRNIARTLNFGSAYVAPSSAHRVDGFDSYSLVYTAAQVLSGDTLRFTIPASWSEPQKGNASLNGYVRVFQSQGTYGDSLINGGARTITIDDVDMSAGEILRVVYGDSTGSSSGMAGPTADAPLDDPSNAFGAAIFLSSAGQTDYVALSPPGGQSLTVPVFDSNVAVAVLDTGAAGGTQFPKGSETIVMRVRFWNSNIGNHTNRVPQITLNVEANTGAAVNANAAISRIRVRNDDEDVTFANVTAIPASSSVTVPLTAFTIPQNSFRDFSIYLTAAASATADTVRFYLTTGGMTAVDSASSKSLTILAVETGVDAAKTGNYDILGLAPAETLAISAPATAVSEVSVGQKDVTILRLFVHNQESSADTPVNQARVDRIVLQVRKNDGTTALNGNAVLASVRIVDNLTSTIYGSVSAAANETLTIDLSGLNLVSNDSKTLNVVGDIATSVGSDTRFRLIVTDTRLVTAVDRVINQPETVVALAAMPFRSDTVAITPLADAVLEKLTLLRTDSSVIDGPAGGQITVGDVFYAALRIRATAGRSSVRMIPNDTDLVLLLDNGGGLIDRTSEFTVTEPAARNIAAGTSETFIYAIVQNLGTNTGTLVIRNDTAANDSRPRAYDAHDPDEPNRLRATWTDAAPETALVQTAGMAASVFALDTSFASPAETSVPVLRIQVKNNNGTSRSVDSVAVDGLSIGGEVLLVRIYHDNRGAGAANQGSLNPATDTLVGTGVFGGDSVLVVLTTDIVIAGSGASETFFVAFDMDTVLTDGDTLDARIPAQGIKIDGETGIPSATTLNSAGEVRVEIVATRVVATPESQIVAVGASPTISFQAVDRFGNLDAVVNSESSVQGHNRQIQFDLTDTGAAKPPHITSTSGMSNVAPAPGLGVASLNARLVGGQGSLTVFDTQAEVCTATLTSGLIDSRPQIQFITATTAGGVNLTGNDSAAADSRGFLVMKFRVTNSSGLEDTLTRVGVRSANAFDTEVSAVILFRDRNGNGTIDSGVDLVVATGNFTNGFADFSGLSDTIATGDSGLYMVGYNLTTSPVDANLLDAQIDTCDLLVAGPLAGGGLNSTPNRRVDIRATRISHSPTTSTQSTGISVTVRAKAVDAQGNVDIHYSGGTGVRWDLTNSADFTGSTLLNQNLNPATGKIQGNFASGQADLYFTDNVAESSILSVVTSPGLTVSNHDTGTFTWEQGISVSSLAQGGFVKVVPGDTDQTLVSFKISATGTSDSITKIILRYTGTSATSCTNYRLYKDVDANDSFSAAVDTFYGAVNPAAFTGDSITFTGETLFIANGGNRSFFFVADVRTSATNGDTLDAQILQGEITTQGGIADVPSGTRNSPGHDTVTDPALSVTAGSVGGGSVPPGANDVVLGVFDVSFDLGQKVLTGVTVTNVGSQPETGLYSLRLYTDKSGNGTFEIATDTLFNATPQSFVNGRATFSGQETFAVGTRRLFVVGNLSDTLATDTKTLQVRISTGHCTFASGETKPGSNQTPTNPIRVSVALGLGVSDSVAVRGGEALGDNVDSVLVSVSVVDSNGIPATGRSVLLTFLDAGPTVVGSNPVATGASGVALFSVRSAAAGVYRCSAAVNGAGKASVAPLSFRDPFGFSNAATANDQQGGLTGATRWAGLGVYSRAVSGNYYHAEYDGGNARIIKNPGATTVFTLARTDSSPSPDYSGSLRVISNGSGGESIVYTGLDGAEASYRTEIYMVNADGTGRRRVSPNTPSDSTGAANADWSNSWRTFDISGDTFWCGFDGNLVSFSKTGAIFNPGADSKTISLWTTFDSTFISTGSSPAGVGVYDPAVSPDGSRVAFTVVHFPANFTFGTAGGGAETAEIWVLTLGGLSPGHPVWNDTTFVNGPVTNFTHPNLVRITSPAEIPFAWKPQWSSDGAILYFSADTTGNFDFGTWQSDYPENSNALGAADFNIFMAYYNTAIESVPYKPAKFLFEGGSIDEIAGPFDALAGNRFAYDRSPQATLWQTRSVTLSNEATVTASGGVLFDSGRVVVFIPSNETLGSGIRITSRQPASTPSPGADSRLVITGAAKEFFSADNPNTHVWFSETIAVILHYDLADFAADQLVGFDSDGDGIPDRTEANLSVYYWDSDALRYEAFVTTRDPDGNRLIFETRHFSLYAGGLLGGQTFAGSVQDAIVYPNPWRIDGVGTATAGLSPSNATYGVKIDRLPSAPVGIRIFTLSGQKVLEGNLHAATGAGDNAGGHLRALGDGRVSWDLRNQHGREVASGIYLMVITGPGGTATRKVAVIR